MQFVEAFEHLGYNVEAPRQDWSAEKEDGICISLWKKEMRTRDGLMWVNTSVHADPDRELEHQAWQYQTYPPPSQGTGRVPRPR